MIIYDDIQIEQIRQIPSINIEEIVELRLADSGGAKGGAYENNIEFSIEEEERETLPMGKVRGDENFKLEGVGEINIDDI